MYVVIYYSTYNFLTYGAPTINPFSHGLTAAPADLRHFFWIAGQSTIIHRIHPYHHSS